MVKIPYRLFLNMAANIVENEGKSGTIFPYDVHKKSSARCYGAENTYILHIYAENSIVCAGIEYLLALSFLVN
jgi:hypothetical protein